MTVGVYRIVNSLTGQSYVGQSVVIEKRWRRHRWQLKKGTHWSKHLQSSYNKHGREAFSYEILCECEVSELDAKEQFYITQYDSYLNGYNSRPFADSKRGCRHSAETRKKISNALAKPDVKEKQRISLVAAMADPEVRKKIGDASKRSYADSDSRERRAAGIRAAHLRPEVKEKWKRKADKMIQAMKHPDMKAKHAEACRLAFAKPAVRLQRSERMKSVWADPEEKSRRVLRRRMTMASKKLVIIDQDMP